MNYFATAYTIHFDDTMAYGSHHFLTSFRFQCFARESLLFGERVFDVAGVREALEGIHLLTADAYARNLNPARLGDRVAILLTLEEWQRASARFCYRVINAQGDPICAGFQTLLCADAATGTPQPLPTPLWEAMEAMRDIAEPTSAESFRQRVLAGGRKTESLFGDVERATAVAFLTERYPRPHVIAPAVVAQEGAAGATDAHSAQSETLEAWVFAGQGAFNADLLSKRVAAYAQAGPAARRELEQCAAIAKELIGGDASAVVGDSSEACAAAVKETPGLSQVAIHLQNVLGAYLRRSRGHAPGFLLGHSFGEIAAFGVAGCFDLPTGIRVVCHRVRAIAEHAPPGGALLAVSADRATVATEAALAGFHQAVIAGRNHDRQTVVSGPRDELERLRDVLRGIDIRSAIVPSPTSFHHPRLRWAAAAWLEQLKKLPLKGPSHALFSPNGRRFIAAHDDIALVLASQLLRPFDLQGAVNDLLEAGVTTFVDCGSPGSLAKIVSQAGPGEVDVISSDQGEETGRKGTRRLGDHSTDSDAGARLPREPTSIGNGSPQSTKSTTTHGRTTPSIAIVGEGCILPGGASSPERLFAAIMQQRSGIVDQRRLDPHWAEDFYSENLVPDRSTSPLAGCVEDSEIVSPRGVDPQVFDRFTRTQQLLCMALAPCVESLKGADRVLCLVGATADGFEDQDVVASLRLAGVDPTDEEVDQRLKTAQTASEEPHAAVQEVFDRVVRPGVEVILVDAACASSLYTVALGMRALEAKRVDAVIAGGVFCPGPGNSCLFSQFRGTTSTGLRPFDASADGVVFSEGAAVVALRRVADAKECGLPISAVLRGVGLSSDGRSSSANVPQTHGQILSLQRCYASYGIDAASIDAIEAHGTSTPMGDATELKTLREFFSDHAQQPIPLHSLKGLLGHAGWAAGTASIIAVCGYLRNGVFPAQAGFREPSKTLVESGRTLTVPTQTGPLPSGRRRIAIDGFGFGGANAHVVLESHDDAEPRDAHVGDDDTTDLAADDELVVVAFDEVAPTLATENGRRFDRENLALPKGHAVLPDLADDMDISQKLAVLLVEGIIAQLPCMDADLRRQTGVLLAQSGKTERGVAATMRVLAPRFRRRLAGIDDLLNRLNAVCETTKPSGPYTLQCMMPNVAAGRAALQHNLNGPNFVIDAGDDSLEAALETASLLLGAGKESGAKLFMVMAINANPWRAPRGHSQPPEEEFAAALAVTTRRYAEELGLPIVSAVQDSLRTACKRGTGSAASLTTADKVGQLLQQFRAPAGADAMTPSPTSADGAAQTSFPIYAPVWVEAPPVEVPADLAQRRDAAILAITRADPDHVLELAKTLSNDARQYRIVVVGPAAGQVAAAIDDPLVTSVNLDDEQSIEDTLAQMDAFEADVVLAIDFVNSWDPIESLTNVGTDNSLCELLFLVAQRNLARLDRGELDLFGLFVGGWNGVVHPASGPVAGLLKAIDREIAAVRVGTICTRNRSLDQAIECVIAERLQDPKEQEIAYDGTVRLARRLRQTPRAGEAVPQVKLDSNSVVVATGAARGVTAVLAEALLKDHQCTVVALGRSMPEAGPENPDDPSVEQDFYARRLREHPQASAAQLKRQFERARARWEAHRTLERLSNAGGRVEYMTADVTDREQVGGVIQQIVSKYGRIDLLLHGAGVQTSQRLERRSLGDFREAFSVKVQGLQNLFEHCEARLGRSVSVHLLTSAYSIFGNDGQHDYGAANETLDRLCGLSRMCEGHHWSSIAWLAWDGIGMTRGSEYRALSQQRGLSGLTAADGQQILRTVFGGRTRAEINVPMSPAEHARYEVKTIPPRLESARAFDSSAGRILEQRVKLSQIDCLSYHKVKGVPTLPGAWILDRMVVTGLKLRDDAASIAAVTIRDASFHRFVRYTEHEPNFRVVAEETGDRIAVWLVGDILNPTGAVLSKDVVFAQATLSFQSEAADVSRSRAGVRDQQFHQIHRHLSDPYCQGQRGDVALSGPFDCVRDIVIDATGRCARYVPAPDVPAPYLPAPAQAGALAIPALVLDAALRVGAMYAVQSGDELYVPLRIGRLVAPVGAHAQAFSTLPREIRTTAPRLENGHVRWDRTEALDESGTPRLIVDDAFATRLR